MPPARQPVLHCHKIRGFDVGFLPFLVGLTRLDMPELAKPKQRPGTMRLVDATQYTLPPAAWVSILHRVSGIIMFVLLPFIIWLLDLSLGSDLSYQYLADVFHAGAGFVPGWFFKLVVLALIWAYLHHFTAGVRHLYMDATHAVGKVFGRTSALFTLGFSLLLTAALGFKLFF
jgi:succinate dehydrogenase / fumarate reductase cytochrome b subunit